jgi:hypothetical protein
LITPNPFSGRFLAGVLARENAARKTVNKGEKCPETTRTTSREAGDYALTILKPEVQSDYGLSEF